MSNAQEAVKTRHKETSLIFPVLALVVLFLWGSSQTLPVEPPRVSWRVFYL